MPDGPDRHDPSVPDDEVEVEEEGEGHDEGHDEDGRPLRAVVPDEGHGARIIQASWAGTVLYTLAAVADLVAVRSLALPVILISSALFVAGLVAFMAAYVIAIGRSREVLIGMGGLYFLAGTAPARVQRHLLGSFAVQVVVAMVTASIGVAVLPDDASNPLAFGFLVPLYGLGLAGLWGARFGTFAPRPDEGGRGRG